MAISYVAQNTVFGTGTTQTCPFSPNPTTGNGLIAFIGTGDPTSTVSSISDTLGNAWTLAGSASANGLSAFCYYVKQCKPSSGTNTFSVTVNTSGGLLEIQLYEAAPGAGANSILLDQAATGTSATDPILGPTGTLAVTTEFAAAYGVVASNVSGITTAGWTQNVLPTDDLSVYQVTNSTAPLNVVWTYGGSPANVSLLMTFQSIAGGSTQVGSDSIAARITALATGKVQRRATAPVNAGSSVRASAVKTAKAQCTI